MVESEEDMTKGYKKALITILTVQGDTELMSATVPLCEGIGIKVPAHYDVDKNEYILELLRKKVKLPGRL